MPTSKKQPPLGSADQAPFSSMRIAPAFDPLSFLRAHGAHKAWTQAATDCSTVGIGTPEDARTTPEQATLLLADLLPYPKHSGSRPPKLHANSNWWAHSIQAASRIKGQSNEAIELHSPPGVCSPYPPVFISKRIAALGRLGADPTKARALMRASFRKSSEEIEAVLALPGCPSPGSMGARGGSALHRASYQGPNPIFAQLARAANPGDWLSEDDQGRIPIELACQNGNLGRSLAIARLTPWEQSSPNQDGDTPLHRLARSMGQLAGKEDFSSLAGLFEELADKLGPDCFFTPNKLGQSPVDLAVFPGLRDALTSAQAKASQGAIGGVSLAASTRVKPKARL